MLTEPKKYCEDLLKGKSLVEMESKIRGLRMSMSRLKRIVENPNYIENVCPSKRTEIKWYRDCLIYARLLYEQAGGVYKPSRAELKAEEFDERIEDIVQVKFSCGSFAGHNVCVISFNNEEVVLKKYGNMQQELPAPIVWEVKVEWLELLRAIHIGEWRKRYCDSQVMDGEQWELEIMYKDYKRVSFWGSNAYPFSYDELIELFNIESKEE